MTAKTLIASLALFFTLSSLAQVTTWNGKSCYTILQNTQGDAVKAPHALCIQNLELLNQENKTQIRINKSAVAHDILSAHTLGDFVQYSILIYDHTFAQTACAQEERITLTLQVAYHTKSKRLAPLSLNGQYLHTPDSCHIDFTVQKLNYTL